MECQTTWLLIGAIMVVWALSQRKEGYGPWPGARPALDPPPVLSRPLQVRDYRVREAPADATSRHWALAREDGSYGTYDLGADPLSPQASGAGMAGAATFDAYLGKEAECSDARTDDVAQAWLEVRRAGRETFGTPSGDFEGGADLMAHVTERSSGRNVSGQLSGVELSA